MAADKWAALQQHGQRLQQGSLQTLLQQARPDRGQHLAYRVGPLYVNFARQYYDRAALETLAQLAQAYDLAGGFQRLLNGDIVNHTENRAALHTALRSDVGTSAAAQAARQQALAVQQQMQQLIHGLENSTITDVVSVGIGGSDLGPKLVADALRPIDGGRFRVHFVSNVDAIAIQRTLAGLNPATTAGIIISKTFSTQETLLNGRILHDWLGSAERLYAVSANPQRAAEVFAIDPIRILPMWDWVGGRYSLWSAVGFAAALAIGFDGFQQLLEGAALMDQHVAAAPLAQNLPVQLGLTSIWNRNALGYATQAVIAYDQRLALLPAYLQQLVMESLGKQTQNSGTAVTTDTVPVWWGGTGTDVQHSFFQALHQGTQRIPIDFIASISSAHPYIENHQALLANMLAQSETLTQGSINTDLHRHYPGGHPNTVILLDALTPQALGALLAMYEHAVYVQSLLWNINAFDQFGVELGKKLANQLLPVLQHKPVDAPNPITWELIKHIFAHRHT